MNKKIILSLLFTGVLLCAHAEEKKYYPLVDENLVWSYCDVVHINIDDYEITYGQTFYRGDTLINGKSYKKVYGAPCASSTGGTYKAAMREEGKKVYVISDMFHDDEERLIYDFDLKEGDVAPSPYSEPETVVVTKTDSIDTADGRRKRIFFPGETWIEGIGSLERDLTMPLSPVPLYDLGFRLNYQKRGDEFTYKTDGFWLKEDDCNASSVENTQMSQNMDITQPTRNTLCINTHNVKSFTLKIYDLSGQLQQSIQGKSGEHIDITPLATGIYMLNINDKAVQKIIKQ